MAKALPIMMRPRDRDKWTPLVNKAGEQVGWDTGAEEIRFGSPAAFEKAEGFLRMALAMKQEKQGSPQEGKGNQ